MKRYAKDLKDTDMFVRYEDAEKEMGRIKDLSFAATIVDDEYL